MQARINQRSFFVAMGRTLYVSLLLVAVACDSPRLQAKPEEARVPELMEQNVKQVIRSTAAIPQDYTSSSSIVTQREAHERAKAVLKKQLPKINASVSFVSPYQAKSPSVTDVEISDALDATVFSWEETNGVGSDIQKDGRRSDDSIVIYAVASQFNGCESPGRFTVQPGHAVSVYRNDNTQGPIAQLQFPDDQVELINSAANLGFNGLCYLLDESTKSAVQHGYFTPFSAQSKQVIAALQTKGHLLEYPCVAGVPKGGSQTVHQVMVAAPAFGGYALDDSPNPEQIREIQFLCALQSFRAQFQLAIDLATKHDRAVVFKPTAVGLGVFGNDPSVVAKAFYHAAKERQVALKATNCSVCLQVYQGTGPAAEMAKLLKLEQSDTL